MLFTYECIRSRSPPEPLASHNTQMSPAVVLAFLKEGIRHQPEYKITARLPALLASCGSDFICITEQIVGNMFSIESLAAEVIDQLDQFVARRFILFVEIDFYGQDTIEVVLSM